MGVSDAKGTHWMVTVFIECDDCGLRYSKDAYFNEPYKFVVLEEELDDLRSELLQDAEFFNGWEVYDLQIWDDYGRFRCRDCRKAALLKLVSPAFDSKSDEGRGDSVVNEQAASMA